MEKELEEIFEKHKEELLELDTQRLEETFDLLIRIVKAEEYEKLLIKLLKDKYKNLEKEYSKLEEKYRNYQLTDPDFEAGRDLGKTEGRLDQLNSIIETLLSKDLSKLKPITYIPLNMLGGKKDV